MTHKQMARTAPGLVFAAALLSSVLGFGEYYDRAGEAATAQALASLDRDLARDGWSPEVRQIAAWAIRTNDHRGLPFVVIDQAHARLFAFSGQGRLAGSTPILLDPVGNDEAAPAGRFVADTRRSARVGAIVWANDHDLLSLDAIPPADQPSVPLDAAFHHHARRSIHVPGQFYREHLFAFRQQESVAYVLPGEPGVRRSFRAYAGPARPLTARSA